MSRLDSSAGLDWYPCPDRAPTAALLPREPQIHADPERRQEDSDERQESATTPSYLGKENVHRNSI